MNWLVISCHPNPQSFTQQMVKTIEKHIDEKDAKRIINLYDINFNPTLDLEELKAPHQEAPLVLREDLEQQIENIAWSDIIIFVYPIWWMQMPAVMKGYFDRVFYYGKVIKQKTNLYEKRILSFVTAGLSKDQQKQKGIDQAYQVILNDFFFFFTGRKAYFKVFSNVNNTDDATRQGFLKEIGEIIQAQYPSHVSTVDQK